MILFETLSQPYIILVVIMSGFLSGLFFDISYIISFLCNDNKIVKNILEFISVVCVFVFTLGKLIAKTRNWCYHIFRKFSQRMLKICKRKRNSKQQ